MDVTLDQRCVASCALGMCSPASLRLCRLVRVQVYRRCACVRACSVCMCACVVCARVCVRACARMLSRGARPRQLGCCVCVLQLGCCVYVSFRDQADSPRSQWPFMSGPTGEASILVGTNLRCRGWGSLPRACGPVGGSKGLGLIQPRHQINGWEMTRRGFNQMGRQHLLRVHLMWSECAPRLYIGTSLRRARAPL